MKNNFLKNVVVALSLLDGGGAFANTLMPLTFTIATNCPVKYPEPPFSFSFNTSCLTNGSWGGLFNQATDDVGYYIPSQSCQSPSIDITYGRNNTLLCHLLYTPATNKITISPNNVGKMGDYPPFTCSASIKANHLFLFVLPIKNKQG